MHQKICINFRDENKQQHQQCHIPHKLRSHLVRACPKGYTEMLKNYKGQSACTLTFFIKAAELSCIGVLILK